MLNGFPFFRLAPSGNQNCPLPSVTNAMPLSSADSYLNSETNHAAMVSITKVLKTNTCFFNTRQDIG